MSTNIVKKRNSSKKNGNKKNSSKKNVSKKRTRKMSGGSNNLSKLSGVKPDLSPIKVYPVNEIYGFKHLPVEQRFPGIHSEHLPIQSLSSNKRVFGFPGQQIFEPSNSSVKDNKILSLLGKTNVPIIKRLQSLQNSRRLPNTSKTRFNYIYPVKPLGEYKQSTINFLKPKLEKMAEEDAIAYVNNLGIVNNNTRTKAIKGVTDQYYNSYLKNFGNVFKEKEYEGLNNEKIEDFYGFNNEKFKGGYKQNNNKNNKQKTKKTPQQQKTN